MGRLRGGMEERRDGGEEGWRRGGRGVKEKGEVRRR